MIHVWGVKPVSSSIASDVLGSDWNQLTSVEFFVENTRSQWSLRFIGELPLAIMLSQANVIHLSPNDNGGTSDGGTHSDTRAGRTRSTGGRAAT
jgi:hypothetical protein